MNKKRFLLMIFAIVLFGSLSIADGFEPSPEPDIFEPPFWLKGLMLAIFNLPNIGPVAIEVMKWLGVLASVATVSASSFFIITKVLTGVLQLAGLKAFAEKLDGFYKKFGPYIKYLSIYNVQKGEIGRK